MTAYTTILSAPPEGGNFLVGDTMTCPATSPIPSWTYCGGGVWTPSPAMYIKRFPTWPANSGMLLASLVASSTAARTNGVVTISATGHAIPVSGAPFSGFRFYYPGSPSLAAGWYDSIQSIVDANTITFSAPGADFGSESINSASAYTTATDFCSMTIPGNTFRDQSKGALVTFRDGSTASIGKTLALVFGGSVLSSNAPATVPKGESKQPFRCVGTTKQIGQGSGAEGALTGTGNIILTKDVTVDQTIIMRGTIAAASEYLAVWGAHLEIYP